jgi:chemotaxis protein MotB
MSVPSTRTVAPRRSRLLALAIVALVAPFTSGCATQQALQAYQDEVITLRDENSRLKSEKLELERQVNTYESELSSLDARLRDASAPLPTPNFSELTNAGMEVSMRGQDLVISIPAGITFASGSASLSPGGQDAVRLVATRLRNEYPSAEYWIEGHTDTDQPTKSKFASNRELSIARARSVHSFLVEQCSVSDQNCIVAGHGEYRPVADNSSAGGKARNRRVEIVVHRR